MTPGTRTLLVGAVAGLAIFALAFAAGFVAGHEPTHDRIAVRLDPASPSTEALHAGVVEAVDGGSIQIATAAGAQRFDLPPGTPIEELAPLDDPDSVAPGAAVNIGGERTNNGYVLTGVVVLEAAP